MPPIEVSGIRNLLLRSLPPDALAALLPGFQRVDMPGNAVLDVNGEPIAAVYFPETGYISLLATTREGGSAEVGMIGYEGTTGVPLLLGSDRSPLDSLVQASGIALRMEAQAFRRATEAMAPLRDVLLRYAMAMQVQIAMTAVCNIRHRTGQRLARWLLMSHDRSEGDSFPMTQDFLSMMLGVRRAGVSVAAGRLRRAGLIRYSQGLITVTDRRGLEAAACECHGVVRGEFRRLLRADLPGRGAFDGARPTAD